MCEKREKDKTDRDKTERVSLDLPGSTRPRSVDIISQFHAWLCRVNSNTHIGGEKQRPIFCAHCTSDCVKKNVQESKWSYHETKSTDCVSLTIQ